LVRIGPTVWISIPDTHTHTQTHTHRFNFIYKIPMRVNTFLSYLFVDKLFQSYLILI
jgi:hypothetical protein